MYYFCTYFDQHYLEKGLTLYHSLIQNCSPFKFWILCMDDTTYTILSGLQLPQVHLILLADFERNDLPLLNAKQNRSLVEYYFTCTPNLPLYILNHFSEVDCITYLDADLYFFSDIEPIFNEMKNKSILMIGHRFPQSLKNLESRGIYNVGLLSFRHDKNGLACLQWWRDRCLEWCFDRVEAGKYADQKYLDYWPDRFAGVVVLKHKGAGLAPWNIDNYDYSIENDKLLIDGQPLIMYHFQGLTQENRWMYDLHMSTYKTKLPKILLERLYYPYIEDLKRSKSIVNATMIPQFQCIQTIRTRRDNLPIFMRSYRFILYLLSPFKFLGKIINGDIIVRPNQQNPPK